MLKRTMVVPHIVFSVVCATTLLGQQQPTGPNSSGMREFPVVLQQSVTAGKTPVGTVVQAKLEVASLVEGVVIPRSAVFSGEVVESVAKSKTDPSRLALRMDSVQWKNGSAAIKVYLTAWFYPAIDAAGQNLQYGPTQPANRTWNGAGEYPDQNSKVYKPFPSGGDSDKGAVPDTPSSTTSNHRVLMKDVKATSGSDGTVTLVSKKTNIKLDRLTTYVLASGDLSSAK
jgi:hypothetical protein